MQFKKGWFIAIMAAIVVFLVIIITKQQTPLPSYNSANDPETTTEYETVKQVDSFTYTDETTGLSIAIPDEWQKVIKSGYTTFIHSPTASSIQIQVQDYYPEVNIVSATSVSTEIATLGGEYIDFYWIDNSSFVSTYKLYNGSLTTDYIEYTLFDRQNVIRIVYTINDEYYDDLQDYITYSLDSISWEKSDPVPTTMNLYYSETGDFEFGTPIGWTGGLVDGAYYASDTTTGASYTITVTASNANFSNVSQINYVSYASQNRTNFILQSFAKDDTNIYATYTYNNGDTRMMVRQFMIANGNYEYSLTEECPMTTYDQISDLFDDLISVFRIFDKGAAVETVTEEISTEENSSEEASEEAVSEETEAETVEIESEEDETPIIG